MEIAGGGRMKMREQRDGDQKETKTHPAADAEEAALPQPAGYLGQVSGNGTPA